MMPIETPMVAAFTGAFGGFVHGFIVSYFLVIEISGRHPVEAYRSAGFEVAIAHIVGHTAFGAMVGYAFGAQTMAVMASSTSEFGLSLAQIYGTVVGLLALIAMLGVSVRRYLHHDK